MNLFKFKTLHAIESVTKEEAKGISNRGHTKINFRFLLFAALIAIATGSFFVACNADDQFSEDTDMDVDAEMREILGEHLTVENNRYVLNLSETDAMKSGISQSFYAKFLSEIAESNDFIESTENDPNMSVNFNIEVDQNIEYKAIRLKNGSEANSNDWIFLKEINPPNEVNVYKEHTINIPSGTKEIKFAFRTSSYAEVNMKLQIMENTSRSVYTSKLTSYDWNLTITQPTTWKVKLAKMSDSKCWVNVYYR
jgi:hypothetical protein